MKLVIVGCGRVGAALATMMVKDGHDVTIIDQNSEAFERLGHDYKSKIKTVIGDGIDEDVLRRAGLESADAFASVTNGDNRNIMSAQIAKHRFHISRVICRIYDPIRMETYKGLGLDSVSPTIVGAKLLRDALVKPVPEGEHAAEPGSLPSGRQPSAAGRPQAQ
jgi:trk/ktr system potassium uptake protein